MIPFCISFYRFLNNNVNLSISVIVADLKRAQVMASSGLVTMKFEFMEVKYGLTSHANKNTVAKRKLPRTMPIMGAQCNVILGTE